jgi:hypothetical protein
VKYAPWLRNATDIVASISSQEVRSVLFDLSDRVEQKGHAIFTPTPGHSNKNIYEIIAASIAAHCDPEDQWLNMKNYAPQAKLTHRSDISAASELQEFRESEEVNLDEEVRRKSAHLAGMDAYAAMLIDHEDGDDEDGTGDVDWEALYQDDELSDELPLNPAYSLGQVGESASHALEDGSKSAEDRPHLFDESKSEIFAEIQSKHVPEGNAGGFNPLDMCSSSHVEFCTSHRSDGAPDQLLAADSARSGVLGTSQHDKESSRPSPPRTSSAADSASSHAGVFEADLFSMPSTIRR